MKVNITVKDVNDNKPELVVDEVYLCENDMPGTVNNNPLSERVTRVSVPLGLKVEQVVSHRRHCMRYQNGCVFIKTRDNFRPGWVKIRRAGFSD